ncbi:MAG TPA: GNAT family N-acetyltransferase [Anaeromyxobacter sp.]|nr:GNAT family N-acetyltransferase [Anaeromyxobacter sp.]
MQAAVHPERRADAPAAARSRGTTPTPRRARLTLRLARPTDAAAVARVMRAAIRALAATHYSPAQLAAWSSLPALYHRWAMTVGGERYVVAEQAGRVVGYAATRRAELTALFVAPRASRSGVGAALLARVEREAIARRVTALRTDAARSAWAFYAAQGFRLGRAFRVPLPGGGALEARAARKPLAGPRRGPAPTAARTGAGTGSGGRPRARGAAGTPR